MHLAWNIQAQEALRESNSESANRTLPTVIDKDLPSPTADSKAPVSSHRRTLSTVQHRSSVHVDDDDSLSKPQKGGTGNETRAAEDSVSLPEAQLVKAKCDREYSDRQSLRQVLHAELETVALLETAFQRGDFRPAPAFKECVPLKSDVPKSEIEVPPKRSGRASTLWDSDIGNGKRITSRRIGCQRLAVSKLCRRAVDSQESRSISSGSGSLVQGKELALLGRSW